MGRRRAEDVIARPLLPFAEDARTPPAPIVASLRSLAELRDPAAVIGRIRNVDWSFTRDDTAYLGHDLHPYPAKFIPQIPSNLIAALSLRGEVVWDPFGGSGTTALEALLLGRRVVSTDINPLASLITLAKCTALSPEQRDDLRALHGRIRSLSGAPRLDLAGEKAIVTPDVPNIERWFSPSAIRELSFLKTQIANLDDETARRFASVALSSIVVAVSNQDAETRYSRRDKELPPGRTLQLFAQALASALAKHEPLEALLGYRRVRAVTLDARNATGAIADESIDLVVTSPPYANATDYHLYHRFRLFWMGFDPREMAPKEVGSHLRHQREKRGFELYLTDMEPVLAGISRALRPGRYAALVVGDSVFDGKTISTADALEKAGREAGMEVVGVVSRPLHETRRSFIAAARRTRSEDILILRRPARRTMVTFRAAPYRMWPYENELRLRELAALLGVKEKKRGAEVVGEIDPYDLDKARRLTFTHVIEMSSGAPMRTWQAALESGDTDSVRKDPKYVTHGIHPYKGKFYPQLCKALLNLADLPTGSTVLDPFCGSGTVLLEAQLNGHMAYGCDMNPLAVLISRAKTQVPTASAVVVDRALKEFVDRVAVDRSTARSIDHFGPELRDEVQRWFPPPVARRLGWLLRTIERAPDHTTELILRVLLSSIIREVSQQEPADLRIRRRREAIVDAPVLDLFLARVNDFRVRLRDFGERASASPVAFAPATATQGDARKWPTLESLEGKVDAVVTSPPYATALPYIDTDRLSMLIVQGIDGRERSRLEHGLTGSREIRETERRALEDVIDDVDLEALLGSRTAARIVRRVHRLNGGAEVGFRRRNMAALLLRYFADMRDVFTNVGRTLRPGAHLFFVIGDNKTTAGDELVDIPSAVVLSELGKSRGWSLLERIPISVTKDAVLHSRHSITTNQVLCFRAT